MADSRRAVRRRLAALAALVSLGVPAFAAGALRSFEAEAGRYLSGHRVEGIGDVAALGSALAAPRGEAVRIEAKVEPRHKARKVRCWGTLMLPYFMDWGLDVDEFDPDAVARGELPDVIFVTQRPGYAQGDVETIYRAAAEGAHVVTLSGTDAWSAAIAKRLGFSYKGVLTIDGTGKSGIAVPSCPALFRGFPDKARLDAEFAAVMPK